MKQRPGAALMLVLWIIVVITTIASGVFIATRSTTDITSNYRARVVARYAAESGVTVAVASLQDSLERVSDLSARRRYLNQLDQALGRNAEVTLGDARFGIALIDVGSRLDLNTADVSQLVRLFSFFTDAMAAESAARAIRPFLPLQNLDQLLVIPGAERGNDDMVIALAGCCAIAPYAPAARKSNSVLNATVGGSVDAGAITIGPGGVVLQDVGSPKYPWLR